ncbi:MAG: AAA family ATPase [Methylococcaceae bacterium]|nr:AAA family ATPase [Methylococcaceae bacterium]
MNQFEDRKKHKTIRALENKARKDDINALFQLAQDYEQGQSVAKDAEQAERYYAQALELFQPQSLQFTSLKLIDFRVFEQLEIDFCHQYKHNSNLTVIIGNNGAGKTTILEALAKSLSWLINSIRSSKDSGKGDSISESDINNHSIAKYASIVSQLLITKDTQYKLELSKSRQGSHISRKSSLESIKQLAALYKLAHSRNDQFSFPIMAFYGAERANDINKKDIEFNAILDQKHWIKLDAYDKETLNGKADFKLFMHWFKYLNDASNANNPQHQEILTSISTLQAELNSELVMAMEKQAAMGANINEFLLAFKQQKQQTIDKLQAQIINKPSIQTSIIIKYVTQVIYTFMPDFSDLRIQLSPFEVLINKNDITLNILQLSQGEKSLLALVADIARRLVLLNPSLDNPLKGNGIVLIDEIDLHLHPTWQQSVIPNLLNTFPNIQFIVTTHSPQTATSVDDKCIRILRNGKVYSAPKGSRGAESSRLLKRAFETEVRPPFDSNTLALAEYKNLIYNDHWECEKAQELRLKLDEAFGDEEPDLTELDLYIENRLWEIELEKN